VGGGGGGGGGGGLRSPGEWNGIWPVSMMYRITPADQSSEGGP
jgi:hypothetical protein